MPDSEDREFIREKIMDKAVGKRHRVQRTIKLLVAAIVFGLVASLFFVLGKKYLEPRFLPEETTPSESITLGRDPEESNPDPNGEASLEGSTAAESHAESGSAGVGESTGSQEETGSTEESASENAANAADQEASFNQKIEEMVSAAVEEQLKQQDNYVSLAWFRRISHVMETVNRGLVTITSVPQDTDWLNHPVSGANQCSGAIIYATDAEVLILADYDAIREAEALTVTFTAGKPVEARIKKADSITGIAIVSVSVVAVPKEVLNQITTLNLGNSYQVVNGTPVVAAGCPAGYTGSMMTGLVSLVQRNTIGTDTAFQLIYPDIRLAETGGGFLFSVEGNLLGILSKTYGDAATGLPAAIGISSLKGIIESLSSGIDAAYLGVQGQNVTAEIAENYGMPVGIFVNKVVMDSPAYLAGMNPGDIIVGSGDSEILTTQRLQSFLESYSTGDVVHLNIYRGGQDEYIEMDFEVTLGAR